MITIEYLPTKKTHAVYASGGPEDGSLYGFVTQCSLEINDLNKWSERQCPVECKNCKRSIAATARREEHNVSHTLYGRLQPH
jgi:hypothetical protein